MALYLVTSTFQNNDDFSDIQDRSASVKSAVREHTRGLRLRHSYIDENANKAYDIVEADSADQIERAASIIQDLGNARVELAEVSEWREFRARA